MTAEKMDDLDKPQYQQASVSEVMFRDWRFPGVFNSTPVTVQLISALVPN
jgi:hypothetical protein